MKIKKERHKIIPASYIVLIKNNQILLHRRFNTGYEDGLYCIPAGHVENEESFLEAAIREAREELGIELNIENLSIVHFMHRKNNDGGRIDVFAAATTWENEPTIMEPTKCDDLQWFDLNNLPRNISLYQKLAINNIVSKIIYCEPKDLLA